MLLLQAKPREGRGHPTIPLGVVKDFPATSLEKQGSTQIPLPSPYYRDGKKLEDSELAVSR